MKESIILSWSGGKDSALALYELQQSAEHEVTGLLTTVTEEYDRISMHGVRRSLLRQQAAAIGLPLTEVTISPRCVNEEYAARMRAAMGDLAAAGIRKVAFGDIFLADVRRYREENLDKAGMKAIFPLWGRNTAALTREFIRYGFKAVLTCADTQRLAASFAGREFDAALLSDLPAAVDPGGENGEFHSFVYNGPIFSLPVRFVRGETILREKRFAYYDLLPDETHCGDHAVSPTRAPDQQQE